MSHYFYNSAFDFVSNDGNFGFYIDESNVRNTDSVGITDEYVIEVHYLGDIASTLAIDVTNITGSSLDDIYYVEKDFSDVRTGLDAVPQYDNSADGTSNTSTIIAGGGTSWGLEQSGLDPAFGVVEIKIPTTSSDHEQIKANGVYRTEDYLYLEAGLYFDIIQKDSGLVTSLQGLIDSTDATVHTNLTNFGNDLQSHFTANPLDKYATSIVDASNDVVLGPPSTLNQVPHMYHFNNIGYFSYDDTFNAPVVLNDGTTIDLSETTLIGEFRIDETQATDAVWSFDVDMEIYMNTNTLPSYSAVMVEDAQGNPVDLNADFINDTGDKTNVSNVGASISRDADGMLTITDLDNGSNTITEGYIIDTMAENATIQHNGGMIGTKNLDVGLYNVSYHPDGGANDTGVVYMDQLVHDHNNNDGTDVYGINLSGSRVFLEDSEPGDYNAIVNGINNGTYNIGQSVTMIFDDVATSPFVIDINNDAYNFYFEVSTGVSSAQMLSHGSYEVNVNGTNDVTLTRIVADTDYDGKAELSTEYKIFTGNSDHNQIDQLKFAINTQNINPYIDNNYEAADQVIMKMDELDTTWNTVTLSGGTYGSVSGGPIPAGIYKVSLVDGSISLQETTFNEGEYDTNGTTYVIRSDNQSAFEIAVNNNNQAVEDLTYKQHFYDLIDPETHDGKEVIQYMEQEVTLQQGTTYVDAPNFNNTGMNFINTKVVYDEAGISYVDAGSGDDLIAGGVGGITVDGGSGFDLYIASPADILIKRDQNQDITSEDGVIVDLTASKVHYLESNTVDVVHNVDYFMGTLGDDKFVGSARYGSPADPTDVNFNNIQVFNPTKGKDEIIGGVTFTDPNTDEVYDVITAVDYDAMQGGQGAIFILNNSAAAIYADEGVGEVSYADIVNFAGEYWEGTSWTTDDAGWLPSNSDIVNENGNFSTTSRYLDRQDATLILDTFGDTDLAFDVDHYIGSGEADIFFGSSGDDSFDAATGIGNFMSGGDGVDQLVIHDLNELAIDDKGTPNDKSDDVIKDDDGNIVLNSIVIDRLYENIHFDVKVDSGTGKLTSDTSNLETGATLYRIDFAEVPNLATFYGNNLSDGFTGYDVSNEYQLFLRTSGDVNTNVNSYTNLAYDSSNQKIDVKTGTDLSELNDLHGQLVIVEQSIAGYTVKGTDNSGSEYSTVIKDVEQVVLTDDEVNYFGTGNIRGSQEDIYQLIQGGQGDLGEMLYVTTGETIDNATGAANYSGGLNFNSSEVFYSGHHTDFDRHSSRDGWAATIGQAFTASEAKVWNDEVAQFFVWYDANDTDNIEGYEIAVKYQNGDVNAWGIDNRQFDTFQNVTVDQTLADAIKLQFGDSVSVELGEYRVLYEAAYTDIETIVNSNADVTKWNFDFQPTSSRSTFYIQVGGGETGLNGSAGISDTLVTNIKVERVEDGDGFKWNINPQAEILVNLPILSGDANDNVMISGDSAETIEAGKGSDVMMGQGGSDNYKISAGDTRDASGNEVVGSFGVAGDVINEIGGSSDDKSDAITLSSAKSIDELSFSRTQIASEYWDNTLKIDVTYDSGAEDTLYVFDHYNQDLSSRAVEQLFLDDGWDSSEIWNLIVGDVNLATGIDEYTGTAGQDILIAGTTKSSLYGGDGQDILIGDQRGQETIFELGNRDSAWDQVADIIEGFGTGDHLDLSALGISDETEIKVNGNQLQLTDDTVVAEFSNFNDGITLDQLLTEDGTILYASTAA